MLPNELALLDALKRREAAPETRARFGTRLHGWPSIDADDNVPVVNSNRARYLAHLETKRAAGHQTESERVAEAEAAMERGRQEARQQLLDGDRGASHPVGTAQARVLGALAQSAEAAGRARREAMESRNWRAQAAQREARRQRMVANAVGGEVGAAERAIQSILRTNRM